MITFTMEIGDNDKVGIVYDALIECFVRMYGLI
jgi:hypothetical protein